MTPEQASKANRANRITIVIGQSYVHRGTVVVIAESDGGGVWLSHEAGPGSPYYLPWHRIGELKEVQRVD